MELAPNRDSGLSGGRRWAIWLVAAWALVVVASMIAIWRYKLQPGPAAVTRAGERCKALGAKRVLPLKVSGAFHSPLMAPAVDGLHDALTGVSFVDPSFPVIANASGEAVRTGLDAKRLLVDQLTSPVRWVACMQTAATLAPGATYLEIGPGAVLAGLLKRIVPGATAISLGTADEVERFLACP